MMVSKYSDDFNPKNISKTLERHIQNFEALESKVRSLEEKFLTIVKSSLTYDELTIDQVKKIIVNSDREQWKILTGKSFFAIWTIIVLIVEAGIRKFIG